MLAFLRRMLHMEQQPTPTEKMLARALDEMADARRESASTLDRIVASHYDRPERPPAQATTTPQPFDAEGLLDLSSDDDAAWLAELESKVKQ